MGLIFFCPAKKKFVMIRHSSFRLVMETVFGHLVIGLKNKRFLAIGRKI